MYENVYRYNIYREVTNEMGKNGGPLMLFEAFSCHGFGPLVPLEKKN